MGLNMSRCRPAPGCLLSVPGEVVVASIQESRESAANNTQTQQPGK